MSPCNRKRRLSAGVGNFAAMREKWETQMNLMKNLWTDEVGVVLSAETVMLGTIGVLTMTAGVGMMSNAMNEELTDVSRAMRSFDQSFQVTGYRVDCPEMRTSSSRTQGATSTLALKTGSGFQQTSAQQTVNALALHPVAAQVVSPNVVGRESLVHSEQRNEANPTSEKSEAELKAELQQLLQQLATLKEAQQPSEKRSAQTY